MARLTKQTASDMSFFIKSGERRRILYNDKCKCCAHDCKQSFRATIVTCAAFAKPEAS